MRRRSPKVQSKRVANQAPRGWCGHCRSKRMVMGTTVHNGVTHPAMVACPQCRENPALQLKLPMEKSPELDAQQRAAGEKSDG